MKGMREIRNRIKAVKSTGQITHAMQLVAASKMKKAQQIAESGRAYATLLMDITESIGPEIRKVIERGIGHSNSNKRLIIVFSTDKGLCGGLNTNLFKTISEIEGDVEFISVGIRAARFIARCGKKLIANFKISDYVKFSESRKIADFAIKTFKEGKFASLEVLYPIFVNTLRQETALVKIAPVDDLDWFIERLKGAYKLDVATNIKEDRHFTFEPSIEAVASDLPQFYIKHAIHYAALDAKASEHSARMVAMKSASDNADSLVAELTLEYNKARQASITTEILELASAAQALENNS